MIECLYFVLTSCMCLLGCLCASLCALTICPSELKAQTAQTDVNPCFAKLLKFSMVRADQYNSNFFLNLAYLSNILP